MQKRMRQDRPHDTCRNISGGAGSRRRMSGPLRTRPAADTPVRRVPPVASGIDFYGNTAGDLQPSGHRHLSLGKSPAVTYITQCPTHGRYSSFAVGCAAGAVWFNPTGGFLRKQKLRLRASRRKFSAFSYRRQTLRRKVRNIERHWALSAHVCVCSGSTSQRQCWARHGSNGRILSGNKYRPAAFVCAGSGLPGASRKKRRNAFQPPGGGNVFHSRNQPHSQRSFLCVTKRTPFAVLSGE